MYTMQGKIWPTHHTHPTLSPRMVPDHTYLTWSTHSNLSRVVDRFKWIPLLPRKKDSQHNPQHTADWSAGPYLVSLPSRSSRFNPSLCWWQSTRLTRFISPAYNQYVQYLLTEQTYQSLIDTDGGYSLEGVGFPHTTSRPFQLTISHFHLRVLPDL
jgi:hypothetical protein